MLDDSKNISERKIRIIEAVIHGYNNSYQIAKWLKSIGLGIDRSRTLRRYLNELEKDGYIWKKDVFLRKPQKRKIVEGHGNIVVFEKTVKLLGDNKVRDSKITRKDLKGYKPTFKAYKLLMDMKIGKPKHLFPGKDKKFIWSKEN